MNTKADFSRRLGVALDHAAVDHNPADRKRWLAKRFDISERQAGNWLNGVQLPTSEGMIEIAVALGVSVEWLVTGRGPRLPLDLSDAEAALLSALSATDRDRLFRAYDLLRPGALSQAA
jgi:transcriptional regulator with XRE-family HTH domain